jgi:ubiquinone/menaquinone biosynthesis C-methylase UbiE
VTDRNLRVCPVERAGGLDNRIRRWIHNPQKILGPYVEEGMTAMDVGCGPGLYAIEMALMVGPTGRVIAVDLQDGMLQLVRNKVTGTEIENRMVLHKCEERSLGLSEEIDFVLAFYMVHELPDQSAFFNEIHANLKPTGRLLVVEPPFHVSKRAFEETINNARNAGFKVTDEPKVLLSKTALLNKE